jgi:hypothetical protein
MERSTLGIHAAVIAAVIAVGCGRIGLDPGGEGANDAGRATRAGAPDAGAAPCLGLDQTACASRPDCKANICGGGICGSTFVGCSALGAEPPSCPPTPCVVACTQLTTEAACEQFAAACHPVFSPFSGVCECAPGAAHCCSGFQGCADGAQAACSGTVTCHRMAPDCTDAGYVISYAAGCFEGCVRADECAP